MFISVTDPQLFNAWIEELKKESVKIRDKYTALLKTKKVKILCHLIIDELPKRV